MGELTRLRQQSNNGVLAGDELAVNMQYAKTLAAAGDLIPKQYQGNPPAILAAVEYGRALGLPPMAALQSINVVRGRAQLSGQAVAALVRGAGHRMRIEEDAKGQRVRCTITRCDDAKNPITAVYTMDDARAMGLAAQDNWKKQPMVMLTWRAITKCARIACPELFLGLGGAYTADEIGSVDADGVIDDASDIEYSVETTTFPEVVPANASDEEVE